MGDMGGMRGIDLVAEKEGATVGMLSRGRLCRREERGEAEGGPLHPSGSSSRAGKVNKGRKYASMWHPPLTGQPLQQVRSPSEEERPSESCWPKWRERWRLACQPE